MLEDMGVLDIHLSYWDEIHLDMISTKRFCQECPWNIAFGCCATKVAMIFRK